MSADHDLRRFPEAPVSAPGELVSQPVEARVPSAPSSEAPVQFDWRKNVVLFLLTVLSVFYVGRVWTVTETSSGAELWLGAWKFAVPLLTILLCHEFGHYIAARLHRVPASLPYFLPLPILNPFGTLGAIILMPRRIRSRKALLDIGAAGPLAGMAVAIPLMLYGLSQSHVGPRVTSQYIQEGQSLLYFALKYLVFGAIAPDYDVQLHPTALAAWAGFLITFLNLLPFSQLDGGHVAYALFGPNHNRIARVVYYAPLLLLAYNFVAYALPVLRLDNLAELGFEAWLPVISSLSSWITVFILLGIMKRATGFDHPPVDDHELSFGRKCIAALTLLLFVLLFMPSPWTVF